MGSMALYLEVYEKILHAIQSGEYLESAPLPAERFLCDKYHVSRSTIRQALMLLKDADVVYTVQGNGTFVKPQVFTQPLTKFYSFTDTLRAGNILIHNEIIDYEIILSDQSMSKKTGYPAGTAFHKLVRLRSAWAFSLMLETTYLPTSRFLKLDLEALAKGPLYDFLKTTYNFKVDRAVETFRPVMPRSEEKSYLQMPVNTPCTLLERFSYEDEQLIEYTKSIVRGDKYIFRSELSNTP